MKLLSSSPSISSSSTISFDPKICTPKTATSRCLSGILRRMLCSMTLPTHPSDHIAEANSVAGLNNKQEQFDAGDSSKVTPGIVARLMGLDYLPELNPNSITRSRSMNSADYKQDTASIHGKHRRVKSTLSLRDVPTYFELENEEFFVLSFEKGSERKEQRSKERKCRDREDRVEKKNKEDDEQGSKRVLNMFDGAKLRKKRRKLHQPVTRNIELADECSSEDSSPVSVLVFDQFIIHHDVPTSEEVQGLNPRRKLSPDLENYGNLMEEDDDDDQRESNIEVKHLESKKNESHIEKNMEVYDAICSVIESEVAKSTWLGSNNEEFEDVTADFESKILNQLLDDLVIQLSGI